MPSYTVTDPKSGHTVTLTGDSPPSEQELEQIFASLPEKAVNNSSIYPDTQDIPLQNNGDQYKYPDSTIQQSAESEPTFVKGMIEHAFPGGELLSRSPEFVGATEAGLSALTGTTSGLFGNIAGSISGIGKSVMNGSYGTQEGAEAAQKEAESTGANLTYSPKSQIGKDIINYISEKTAPLSAATPFTQELGIIGQSAKASIPSGSIVKASESPKMVENQPQQAITQADRTGDIASSFANSGMKNRIDEITNNISIDPIKVAAAKRLDIKSPIATLSNDRSLQEIAGALAASPGSKAAAELADYHSQLTSKAQQLIKDAGGDIDRGLVSDELKDKMDSNIKLLKAQSSDIYKQIGDAVPPETIVNSKPLIRELNARAGKSQQGIKGLSQVEQDVYNTLQGKPTYFDLDNLRKDIGESIGGFKGTYTTAPKAKLDDMYSKLTDLQAGVADQVGAGAGKLWDQAKSLDKSRFELQESSQFLFGKDLQGSVMPKVEQGLKQLAKGNPKIFNETLQSIPEAMRNRVIMSGLDSVLSKTSQGESSLSPVQFNNWYGELSKSPTNKNLLHKNLPEGAGKRLDDLFKLSQGLQNVTSKVVRTGIVHDAFKNFDANGGLVDKLYNTAEKVSKIPVVGSALGAPAIRVGSSILKMAQAEKTPAIQAADDLLSSPEFKTAILDYQRNGVVASAAQKKLAISTPYKNYINAQDSNIVNKINAIGLIPYLTGQDDQK